MQDDSYTAHAGQLCPAIHTDNHININTRPHPRTHSNIEKQSWSVGSPVRKNKVCNRRQTHTRIFNIIYSNFFLLPSNN